VAGGGWRAFGMGLFLLLKQTDFPSPAINYAMSTFLFSTNWTQSSSGGARACIDSPTLSMYRSSSIEPLAPYESRKNDTDYSSNQWATCPHLLLISASVTYSCFKPLCLLIVPLNSSPPMVISRSLQLSPAPSHFPGI